MPIDAIGNEAMHLHILDRLWSLRLVGHLILRKKVQVYALPPSPHSVYGRVMTAATGL